MISGDPLVTIVTPSYNQGRFIRATIESVLSQDYPYIEYIIVDGASTDETARVVEPYLDRLTFISEPDRGQTHAVNKGFARARGEIVAWLNSDDLFLPGAVRLVVEKFKSNPKLGVVYGGGFQIDEEGKVKQRFPYTQHFDLWKLVFTSDYILNQSAYFRKAALDAVGPLREELYYIMDWEILMRMGVYFEFGYIPDDIGCLREYGEAKTFTGGVKRIREMRHILREYTGMPYSPAYIVYGLDTYQYVWRAAIERWPAVFNALKPLASRVVTKFCHIMIRRATERGQAWWQDRWMGPRAYVMLPQGMGEITMRGLVPQVPGLREQVLTVRYKGKKILKQRLAPGEFEVRFVPPIYAEETPIFQLTGARRFVFAQTSGSTDYRELSLRLNEFRWSHSSPA